MFKKFGNFGKNIRSKASVSFSSLWDFFQDTTHFISNTALVVLCNPGSVTLQMLFLLWLGGLKPWLALAYFAAVALLALWADDKRIRRENSLDRIEKERAKTRHI